MKVSELAKEVHDAISIRESTWKCWLKAVKPIAEIEVESVDKKLVKSYWKSQLKPHGPLCKETCRRRLSLLAGIWSRGVKENIISVPNYWYKESECLPQGIVYSKYGKEYPVREASYYGKRQHDPFFMAIWLHGFRIGELAGLKTSEIVFNSSIPYFDIKDNSNREIKPGSARHVPIHPIYFDYLDSLQLKLGTVTGKSWSDNFHRDCELPKGEAAHSLRHNFISRCRSAELEDSMISKLVGHRPAGMTGRYGSWTLNAKYAAISKVKV